MNGWITEQLLQDEIRTNERIREEFEQAARLQRQREGEITGYAIKTKRHSKTSAAIEKDTMNASLGEDPTVGAEVTSADVISQNKSSEENAMCTICLLELEDGDRIADLGCGHFYHAECLGEWVLKKVGIIRIFPMKRYLFRCHIHIPLITIKLTTLGVMHRIHALYVKIKESPLRLGTMTLQRMEMAITPKVAVVDGD